MKRFLAGIVFSLLISAAGVRAGQRMYEVGTVYIFLPSTSNEQIVRDLETMAATGINTVEICPSFLLTPGNPEPDFSKTDLILKTCRAPGAARHAHGFLERAASGLCGGKMAGPFPSHY